MYVFTGIPDQPELAETYYSQFEFDPDDDDEDGDGLNSTEGTLVAADEEEDFIKCLQGALDKSEEGNTNTVTNRDRVVLSVSW